MPTFQRWRVPVAVLALTAGLLPAAAPSEARLAAPTPPTSGEGTIVFASGYVAFTPDPPPSEVYAVEADGTGLRQLTDVPDDAVAGAPDLSADGTRIAYVSDETGDLAVWTMTADGADQQPLLDTDGVAYLQPRWSPDGSRLAAAACTMTPFPFLDCDIVVVAADGTGLRTLVAGHRLHRAPAWSPDGTRIAFDSDRAGFVSAIWVVPAAGGRPVRLTDPDLEAFWPGWSPDGSRLVFSSGFARPHSDVYSMRADGSQVRRLTRTRQRFVGAFHASYSPDGRRIVLIDDELRAEPGEQFDLFTMRTDGSHLRRVVDQPAFTPDWGPEGASR